jgi:hypothetical protein
MCITMSAARGNGKTGFREVIIDRILKAVLNKPGRPGMLFVPGVSMLLTPEMPFNHLIQVLKMPGTKSMPGLHHPD